MTTTNSAPAVSRDQNGGVHDNNDPAARPTRRTFSTDEKLALLAAYELCDPGTKGEFARREGIYSSQLTEWRGMTSTLSRVGRRAPPAGTIAQRESTASRRDRREFDKLEAKNKKLEAELERTRLALDIVGKAHALLEKLSESADNE
jgi:transposase